MKKYQLTVFTGTKKEHEALVKLGYRALPDYLLKEARKALSGRSSVIIGNPKDSNIVAWDKRSKETAVNPGT